MAYKDYVSKFKRGLFTWNLWREQYPLVVADLSGIDLDRIDHIGRDYSRFNLSLVDLSEANLSKANFSAANFSKANLCGADLSEANLSEANLNKTDLSAADLSQANLRGASLIKVELNGANLSEANLIEISLSGANLSGVNFNRANLEGADLSGANLTEANLRGANLSRANLSNAKLTKANLDGANLNGSDLSEANLRKASFNRADLMRAILKSAILKSAILDSANLSTADLSEANLDSANLSGADLSWANLIGTQARGTNFTGANFTGAIIEDWNINSTTKLHDVICDYIYLREEQQERRPSDINKNFAPGDFTKLFQKALETVDLIFAHGIDWKAFLLSFQELKAEYGEENLSVQAIEKKSGGTFVIRLEVPPEANKVDIERQAKALYEIQLKALEARYHAELQAKDEQIVIYRQQNATLENVINILGNRPIQNIINVTAKAENSSMVDNSKKESNFDLKGAQFGGGLVNADTVTAQQIGGNITNYTPEQKQNLASAAAEIQQLLYQLSQTSSSTDEAITEAIHQKIKRNPTLKARLISALEAGGLEALKAIFNHPLFSIPAETIKGWLEAE